MVSSRIIAIPCFKALLLAVGVCFPTKAAEDRPAVLLARRPTRLVSGETMEKIYQQVKTPFKFGIVIRGEDGNSVDCPSIFRYDQRWYMVYVCMNKVDSRKNGRRTSCLTNYRSWNRRWK